MGAATFLDSHWGKRALHASGSAPRLEELALDDTWLEQSPEIDAASVDAAGRQHQVRIGLAQAATLYASGFTICANVSGTPAIAALSSELSFELGLAGKPFAKLYSSPDDRGFALHFDSFHVFVVQLAGAKRWRFSPTPAVDSPLTSGKLDARGRPVFSDGDAPVTRDDGTPVEAPDPASLDEVELTPGDVLYLPPGTWHVARARGHSVALSLSPPRTPLFALFSRVLEEHLGRHVAWRRDAFTSAPFDGSGKIPEALASQFDDALADLRAALGELDPRTIHRLWQLNVPRPAAALDREPPRPARPVEPHDRFAHDRPEVARFLVSRQSDGAEAIFIYAGAEELSLPIGALRFVQGLAKAPVFTGEDASRWDDTLGWPEVETLLAQLLEARLVRRLP